MLVRENRFTEIVWGWFSLYVRIISILLREISFNEFAWGGVFP